MPEFPNIAHWIRPTSLFNEGRLYAEVLIGVVNGQVQIVTDDIQVIPGSQIYDFDGIISPGFLDLQVNGGGGVLFNEAPTKESIWDIAKAHKRMLFCTATEAGQSSSQRCISRLRYGRS